jgi:hypothetical protein
MITKYSLLSILVLILIYNTIGSSICYSQDKEVNYLIIIKSVVPIATSKTTFKTYWLPVIDISVSGLKYTCKNLYTGLNIDYSRFYIGKWIYLKSRLHIINPNIAFRYDINFLKRLKVSPEASFGYSWMSFTNPVTPSSFVETFNESGVSLRSGIDITYVFRNNLSLGLNGSYKTIFKKFGNDSLVLYESRAEAYYTAYLNIGISFGFYF